MKESGLRVRKGSGWAVVSSYGQMAPDTRASGAKGKPADLEDSFTPMVTVTRGSGARAKPADKASMFTLMGASTLANSMLTTKTGMGGRSGQMEPCSKANL